MRSALLLCFLGGLVSCQPKQQVITTRGNLSTNNSYVWTSKSFPKNLVISTDYAPSEVTHIKSMGEAWKTATENKRTFFAFTEGVEPELTHTLKNTDHFRDNKLGIYKATKWPYTSYPGALAVTQIWGNTYNKGTSSEFTDILEADIVLNYEWFNFTLPGDYSYGYDFRTVMLHEMGHFLGLQHQATLPRHQSVMYPSINSTEVKDIPQLVDAAELAHKYGITLGTAGGSYMAHDEAPQYIPYDEGEPVKIILELRADGECVHHIDGAVVGRHHVNLK